jgi:hypothetical protein
MPRKPNQHKWLWITLSWFESMRGRLLSLKHIRKSCRSSAKTIGAILGPLRRGGLTVTIPGGHDREWYQDHGYKWHDGQWYRGEERERYGYREHHRHDGYWKNGHYYRYGDEDRD